MDVGMVVQAGLAFAGMVAVGWYASEAWDKGATWVKGRDERAIRREYERAAARRLGEHAAETFAAHELRGGPES